MRIVEGRELALCASGSYPCLILQRPTLQRVARLRGLREIALVALLYAAYTGSRLLADADRWPALLRAHRILDLESVLGLNWEHHVVRFVVAHPMVGLLSSYWYSTAHYVVTPLVLVWLWRRGREVYVPARRALLIATVLGLLLYLMLPTAPPRMMDGFPDVLAMHADAGWWGAGASAPRGTEGLTNELAAFPSLHAGWSLWVALAVQSNSRRTSLRVAGWLHAGLTAFVVIGTANHWVLDVLMGWVVVAAAWTAAGVERRRTQTSRSARDAFDDLLLPGRRVRGALGSTLAERPAGDGERRGGPRVPV